VPNYYHNHDHHRPHAPSGSAAARDNHRASSQSN